MAAVMIGAAPVHSDAVATLRLQLRELALQAGLGADIGQLAPGLRAAYDDALPPAARWRSAELQRLAGAFVAGVCGLARWLEPQRSAQAVPPLCVVLWHVGRSFRAPDPATLWLDFVLPDDGRCVAASAWAQDVRLLLAQAAIDHRAETVRVKPPAAGRQVTAEGAKDVAAWGCMSLYAHYQCAAGDTRPLRG